MDRISPHELKQLLLGDEEFALIDVREQGVFAKSHLLFAVSIPLSQIELIFAELVPCRGTKVIIVDSTDSSESGLLAINRLAGFGYRNLALLAGGVAAWAAAGFELFSGVNVPSKAFGEFVETRYDTPRLSAAEVKSLLDRQHNMVVVDSRPYAEFHRMSIPTGIDMPGAELVYRIHDVAPDPATLVVVNCAGRTRSIIGAQSLINAGIPNPVVALKDGTMGWHLAGFSLAHGATGEAGLPGTDGLIKARAAASRVAQRFGVRTVTADTVAEWCDDPDRTTYLLDVRSPAEYVAGHRPGFRNAPGGQLVQATDEYVAVKNARIVLADDVGVRATMTASWLTQMGWRHVRVLAENVSEGTLEEGAHPRSILGTLGRAEMTGADLAKSLDECDVIDLGPSPGYAQRHIPGALWCPRVRLAEALTTHTARDRIVLTSPDGMLARLALAEARGFTRHEVQALAGGTERWFAEGRPGEAGIDNVVGETDDVWYKPYEHRTAQEAFMRDYLSWEVALVDQIERDGTTRFRRF